MSSRSTPVDPNEFPKCLNALSLDAGRSKCISGVFRFAFARQLSIQMRFRYAQMSSRSTPVDPIELPKCLNALSLIAGRSKCVSGVLRRALAGCLPFQMPFVCCQMHSSSTQKTRSAVHPNMQRISNRGAQPGRAKRGPPREARCRAKRGRRRRRPAPKAPPSCARASNESWNATPLATSFVVAYKQPGSAGKRALHVRDIMTPG